ncbi:NUDIX hydrolase [Microlunatus ginsengisoli]|uniref:NUDIX hydrolase n=1 Tax=Microlunatus ginsengisoli TaxID=363863 RepID=A0ABP6ZMW5_9ACTN
MTTVQRSSTRRSVGTTGRPTLAGGAVVTRQHPVRGREVVIIHRKRYDDWTLPKGKVHAGESIPAAAVREVEEETGVRIRLGVPLDTIRYEVPKAGIKQVDYWAGTMLSAVRRAPDAEVDVVSWLPIRAALGRLTYAHDHFLLEQFLEQPPTTPLILVRHGKAMDRKDWSKKDSARPLASRGRSQSKKLVPMLDAYGITRLVTSTSARCVSTMLPYAESHKLVCEQHPQLTEEEGADDPKGVRKTIQAIRQVALSSGEPTAICIHRPVLPHILAALDMAPLQLATGEFVVAHLSVRGEVHAIERHRPIG